MTPPGLGRRRRRAGPLTLDGKLDIVPRVLVDGEAQKELAKEYRYSQAAVSALVTKVRKKPELLRELITARAKKQLQVEELAEFIELKM